MNRGSTVIWYDYDYALIRVVPRVQLGVFWNVGVILNSRTAGFLGARYVLDREKIEPIASPHIDLDILEQHLDAIVQICKGGPECGQIGLLPASEPFHWLTAPRSAVIQMSEIHPGRTYDPAECLDSLFNRLILVPAARSSHC